MIIRNLNPADLDALCALDMACFEKPWVREALLGELGHEDAVLLGVFEKSLVAALLTRRVAGELWIFRIMTHPDWRRQHLAAKLLEALPKESLWLEVSVDNLGAIRFYEQMGFQVLARRPGYYPEDALVMRRDY